MMQLSPDQFASLKRVLSDPAAKIAAALNLDQPTIEGVLSEMEKVARRGATTLGSERLLLIYQPGSKHGNELDNAALAKFLRNKTPFVTVGDDGSWIKAEAGAVSIVSAGTESEKGPALCAVCTAGHLYLFANGKPVAELGVPSMPIHGRLDWMRSWRELRACFDDHFKECIDSEKNLRYWADRKKRILLAGPDGTEKLFHLSLFWWCKSFIKDAIEVFGEAQAMGQDKTDITIVTEVGSIVVEVKWLGVNENGTPYAEVRIHEGVLQVADYLQRNGRLMGGYLVIYDARSEKLNQTGCSYPQSALHAKCEEPIIFFLRSETPSEMAVRLAAEVRKTTQNKKPAKTKTKVVPGRRKVNKV